MLKKPDKPAEQVTSYRPTTTVLIVEASQIYEYSGFLLWISKSTLHPLYVPNRVVMNFEYALKEKK